MEENIARIHVAWALLKQGVPVREIAQEVGKDRSTIYRWRYGIKAFISRYREAKKGRRVRRTQGAIEQRILSLRRAYRECCGEKIVYLLEQEGVKVSQSTVYRVLNRHLTLRKHHRTTRGQPAQRGQHRRDVVQMDSLDLGDVYAFTAIDTWSKEAMVVMRPALTAQEGQAALEVLAQRFGPVRVLLTDGGSEFEKEFAQVVHLYAQEHVIARPYKKNDQAFIECFNGTLRREEFGRPAFKPDDLALAQQRADAFLDYYHHQRPHLALDMKTPARFVAESHLP